MENPSYIFRAPKSKHIVGGLAIIALILSRQAPKLIIGDRFNKGGPTLRCRGLGFRYIGTLGLGFSCIAISGLGM